jgi:hypothetical protein
MRACSSLSVACARQTSALQELCDGICRDCHPGRSAESSLGWHSSERCISDSHEQWHLCARCVRMSVSLHTTQLARIRRASNRQWKISGLDFALEKRRPCVSLVLVLAFDDWRMARQT